MLEAAHEAGVEGAAADRVLPATSAGGRRSRWSASTARRSAGGSCATRRPGCRCRWPRSWRRSTRSRRPSFRSSGRPTRSSGCDDELDSVERAASGDRARPDRGCASGCRPTPSSSSATATCGSATSSSTEGGLVAVLDWEFAHLARSGRGRRVAARPRVALRRRRPPARRRRRGRAVPRALQRADRPRAHARGALRLGGARQRQVGGRLPDAGAPAPERVDRSVELAVLGRFAAEMEYELLDLIEHA